MILLSLKNRLRSRTSVIIFKFQSALDLKNWLRSRTLVATLMIKYVLETSLRACIQRAVFCIHKLKAKPSYEIEPNRDLVLRDEKVLPEVRNRPLLPRFFSAIQPLKFFANPMGEPSVLHIKCPIYIWDQAEAWEVFGIGGWYVLSCTSKHILKFTVKA